MKKEVLLVFIILIIFISIIVFALPIITFIPPTLDSNSYTNNNWIFVNITSNENLNQSLLEWGNSSGFTNVSMSNNSLINWYKNMTELADYTYNYTIWAQNTTGNWNQSGRYFITVDTINPSINFTSPTPAKSTTQSTTSVYVNISTSDTNEHSAFIDWDRSLVGWWNFENVLSGTVYDNSSYDNDGIMKNFISNTTVSGKRGKALEFNGVDDYIEITDNSNLDITDATTISAWTYNPHSIEWWKLIDGGYHAGDNTTTGTLGYGANYIYFKKIATNNTGEAQSISFYQGLYHYIGHLKAAIYTDDSGPADLVANSETEEIEGAIGKYKWNTLNINGTKPILLADTTYWIATWSDTAWDGPKVVGGAANSWANKAETYGSWPSSITGETLSALDAGAYITITDSLSITTAGLPYGNKDFTYSETLEAVSGTQPYTWSIDGGSLPDGLRLSSEGIIIGIPNITGNFTFTVEVTDNVATTDTKELNIFVNNFPTYWKQYNRNPVVANNMRDVVKVNGTYYMYGEGLVGGIWEIYVWTSTDGIKWGAYNVTGQKGALFEAGAAGSYDEKGQADPTVVYDGSWHMWFDAQNGSNVWYGIGYATSDDGLNWTKNESNPVITMGDSGAWDDSFIHHPVVLKIGDTYYMYYAGDDGIVKYKIGLASSTNRINWTKEETNPLINNSDNSGDFDYMHVRPSKPIIHDNLWHMWYWGYNGSISKIGLATSSDGIVWTKKGVELEPGLDGSWSENNTMACSVIKDEGVFKMWYLGRSSGIYTTGYAVWPIDKTIVGKGKDAYGIQIDSDLNVIGFINNQTVATNITKSWHHLAFTYNGSEQKLYVDGVLKDNQLLSGSINTNTNNFTIGKDINSTIDEVMIFNRALTPEEINASYQAGTYRLFRSFTSLSDATYNYRAYAIDEAGNVNSTELRAVTISTTAEAEETTSGGGSPTYKPTQEQVEEGYTKSLYENWKIEFEFGNETRTIKLDDIINKTAIIIVSSIPQTFNLTVNETKKLNLNDDGFYDLQIFLKNITDYKADLIVTLIHEEIPFEEVIEEEEKGILERIRGIMNKFIEVIKPYWLWILIGVGSVIVIVVGIIVFSKIRKEGGSFKKKISRKPGTEERLGISKR